MQLRYSFRIEPGPGQRVALGRAFGCARVVFNDCLRARKQAHEQGLAYPTSAEPKRGTENPPEPVKADKRF